MAALTGADRQRYVADLFARISRRYDLMNDVITLGMHRGWKRKTANLATQALPGPALDVSTGTGDLAFQLAGRPSADCIVALDLLPEMISRALGKAAAQGDRRVSFMVGDALALPFPT
jgi:demethylmenaquinone methyltransferase/2-methoxy-6-polyprenyl-1,4-benzoquinol methylase